MVGVSMSGISGNILFLLYSNAKANKIHQRSCASVLEFEVLGLLRAVDNHDKRLIP